MAIEQKAIDLHHPPRGGRRLKAASSQAGLPLEDGVNAPVAVGRQFGDRRPRSEPRIGRPPSTGRGAHDRDELRVVSSGDLARL
jgi:hypothetical protein